MSIEQDIQQSRFRNEFQKALVNLIYTSGWINEQTRSIFDAYGLTSQQFNILRILRGAGKPISTLQIRQRMLDKMSDTSRIVDRLVLKELVTKTTSASDKRLVDVAISEKGLSVLSKLDEQQEQIDGITKNLSEDEAAQLNSLLDKVRNKALP